MEKCMSYHHMNKSQLERGEKTVYGAACCQTWTFWGNFSEYQQR